MRPSGYHVLALKIEKPNGIVRFTRLLPPKLKVCTGIKLNIVECSDHPVRGFSRFGYVGLEFNGKRKILNLPVQQFSYLLIHPGFLDLDLPLENSILTGYYKDETGMVNDPASFCLDLHIYLRYQQL